MYMNIMVNIFCVPAFFDYFQELPCYHAFGQNHHYKQCRPYFGRLPLLWKQVGTHKSCLPLKQNWQKKHGCVPIDLNIQGGYSSVIYF